MKHLQSSSTDGNGPVAAAAQLATFHSPQIDRKKLDAIPRTCPPPPMHSPNHKNRKAISDADEEVTAPRFLPISLSLLGPGVLGDSPLLNPATLWKDRDPVRQESTPTKPSLRPRPRLIGGGRNRRSSKFPKPVPWKHCLGEDMTCRQCRTPHPAVFCVPPTPTQIQI